MMRSSLAEAIPHLDQVFIGGEWSSPSSSSTIAVIEASTEEVLFRIAEAQEADVDRAVTAARHAFDHGPWPWMSHAERADYLRRIGAALDARAELLGQIWTGESGVVNAVAVAMSGSIGRKFDGYADLVGSFPFEERHTPTAGGRVGFLVREPVGVVGAIVPWNGPMSMIANKVAPALLAGCTVIVKASPEAPGAAHVIAEVAQEVGLPAGVLNVVVADRAVSEKIVTDPRVDKITFTGSTAAGKRIAALCGERVARCTLELGGKSAGIVLDDFDVEAAATAIVGPACFLSGQVCSSLTRIIVDKRRHDDLVDALADRFRSVNVGDPYEATTQMGPLVSAAQRDRVEGYIAEGVNGGASLATGGRRPGHLPRGYFIEPTVFANVDNRSRIAQEEIFGPVLSVIAADDERHAVQLANDSVYGLNASVFTNDATRAKQVAGRLRSGTVGHNAFRTDFGIAFGGYKQSGIGREGGREGVLPFLEVKTIILEDEPEAP